MVYYTNYLQDKKLIFSAAWCAVGESPGLLSIRLPIFYRWSNVDLRMPCVYVWIVYFRTLYATRSADAGCCIDGWSLGGTVSEADQPFTPAGQEQVLWWFRKTDQRSRGPRLCSHCRCTVMASVDYEVRLSTKRTVYEMNNLSSSDVNAVPLSETTSSGKPTVANSLRWNLIAPCTDVKETTVTLSHLEYESTCILCQML